MIIHQHKGVAFIVGLDKPIQKWSLQDNRFPCCIDGTILIYVQDLPQWVTNSIVMFADDTKLWARISTLQDGEMLQRDLLKLAEWSRKWLLAFKPEKCKVMHIGNEVETA